MIIIDASLSVSLGATISPLFGSRPIEELALATLALAKFLHIPFAGSENLPIRDVWVLFHLDQQKHRPIIAVKDWIANIER